MTSPLLVRLLLAILLVVNGVGGAFADARGMAEPVSALAETRHRVHPVPAAPAAAATAMPGCHEAAPAAASATATAPAAPAHGHCCLDACHCVCTLQAHAPALVPAAVPLRTVAGLSDFPGWAAPDPALLLRPPIA